jgi:hypothetical protein
MDLTGPGKYVKNFGNNQRKEIIKISINIKISSKTKNVNEKLSSF